MQGRNIILVLTAILLCGCYNTDKYEVEDWHYLNVEDSYISSYGGTDVIRFLSDIEFEVEPIEYVDWLSDFKMEYSKIYVTVDENESTEERFCDMIAWSDKYNIADTFRLTQTGVYTGSSSSSLGGGSSSSSSTTTSSKRCIAITKKGTRCKRRASSGSSYCWQHKP